MKRGMLTITENVFVPGDEIYVGDDPLPLKIAAVDAATYTLTVVPLGFWRGLLYALVVMLD